MPTNARDAKRDELMSKHLYDEEAKRAFATWNEKEEGEIEKSMNQLLRELPNNDESSDSINEQIYAGQIAHFEQVIMVNPLLLDPMCQNCGDNIALPFSVYCSDCFTPKEMGGKLQL